MGPSTTHHHLPDTALGSRVHPPRTLAILFYSSVRVWEADPSQTAVGGVQAGEKPLAGTRASLEPPVLASPQHCPPLRGTHTVCRSQTSRPRDPSPLGQSTEEDEPPWSVGQGGLLEDKGERWESRCPACVTGVPQTGTWCCIPLMVAGGVPPTHGPSRKGCEPSADHLGGHLL